MSLFSLDGGAEGTTASLSLPDVPPWSQQEKLAHEKEAIGFYISGHPLDPYRDQVKRLGGATTATLSRLHDGASVGLAGVVRSMKEITTKKGDRMAFVVLEDHSGSVEVVCFPETYRRSRETILSEQPLWVKGTYKRDEENSMHKILAEEVMTLEAAAAQKATSIVLKLEDGSVPPLVMERIRDVLLGNTGEVPVKLEIARPGLGAVIMELPEEYRVSVEGDLVTDLNHAVGRPCVFMEYGG